MLKKAKYIIGILSGCIKGNANDTNQLYHCGFIYIQIMKQETTFTHSTLHKSVDNTSVGEEIDQHCRKLISSVNGTHHTTHLPRSNNAWEMHYFFAFRIFKLYMLNIKISKRYKTFTIGCVKTPFTTGVYNPCRSTCNSIEFYLGVPCTYP